MTRRPAASSRGKCVCDGGWRNTCSECHLRKPRHSPAGVVNCGSTQRSHGSEPYAAKSAGRDAFRVFGACPARIEQPRPPGRAVLRNVTARDGLTPQFRKDTILLRALPRIGEGLISQWIVLCPIDQIDAAHALAPLAGSRETSATEVIDRKRYHWTERGGTTSSFVLDAPFGKADIRVSNPARDVRMQDGCEAAGAPTRPLFARKTVHAHDPRFEGETPIRPAGRPHPRTFDHRRGRPPPP